MFRSYLFELVDHKLRPPIWDDCTQGFLFRTNSRLKIGSGNQLGEFIQKVSGCGEQSPGEWAEVGYGGRWTDKQSGGSAMWRLDGLTGESVMMKQLLQPWGTKRPWQEVERRSTCTWAGNAEAEGKLLLPPRTRVKAVRCKFCVLNLGKFTALSKKGKKKNSSKKMLLLCCCKSTYKTQNMTLIVETAPNFLYYKLHSLSCTFKSSIVLEGVHDLKTPGFT